MMTTPDFIRHWVRGAERDWHAAEVLLTAGAYSQCIFFAHLTVEKLAKAHWIREHEEPDPPMWHNIGKILQLTSLVLPADEQATAVRLSALQVESRYPDYTISFFDTLSPADAQDLWNLTDSLRQFLLARLP